MSESTQSQSIESLDLNIAKILNDFYVVPSYQREYVWTDREVEQLLHDIYTEFPESVKDTAVDYFVGSVVVCPGMDGVLDLIDGQQRMTTFFIVICAFQEYLRRAGLQPLTTIANQICASSVDPSGNEMLRFRVSLQYKDSSDILERIGRGGSVNLGHLPATRSVTNIVRAYECALAFIDQKFGNRDTEVKRFYAYFVTHVKLVRIQTQSVSHALKVFETVNDRGVGLDSMDLLKNLMFIHASESEYVRLGIDWKELVDTLFKAKEKPLRFLRYYIFANFNVDRLREDEIYRWFTRNEESCGFASNPVGFVGRLRTAAASYQSYSSGKNPDGSENRFLSNIRELSHAARQHYILLLAGEKLPPIALLLLSRQIENLLFAYVITREPTRDFERNFAAWAPKLRDCSSKADVEEFIRQYIEPALRGLSSRFDLAFSELSEKSMPRYQLRYVVGKLAQFVNEKANFDKTKQSLGSYLQEKELEHILPQSEHPDVTFDRPDEYSHYVCLLGNITLLEAGLNASASNLPFVIKKTIYSKSQYLLTRTMADNMGDGHSKLAIATKDLRTFEKWDSSDIEERQRILGCLAREAWGIPSA